METKRDRYSVVSLFSGCGGMDLGFQGGFNFLGKRYARTCFDIVWANELNKAACHTYRSNISNNILEGDIWNMISELPQSADLVIGGFPCQDISVNGKGAGGKRQEKWLISCDG
jgi:DNA (cytosine-5)-methyltransferase 1